MTDTTEPKDGEKSTEDTIETEEKPNKLLATDEEAGRVRGFLNQYPAASRGVCRELGADGGFLLDLVTLAILESESPSVVVETDELLRRLGWTPESDDERLQMRACAVQWALAFAWPPVFEATFQGSYPPVELTFTPAEWLRSCRAEPGCLAYVKMSRRVAKSDPHTPRGAIQRAYAMHIARTWRDQAAAGEEPDMDLPRPSDKELMESCPPRVAPWRNVILGKPPVRWKKVPGGYVSTVEQP